MWILDAQHRKDVEIWVREGDACRKVVEPYRPCFYLHVPDEHRHLCMIEALARDYSAEECSFETINGRLDGYRVYAGRDVAEKIERQTRFSARLFNVDVRLEQRFLAERGLFPLGGNGEDRFSPDFDLPIRIVEMSIDGNPAREDTISSVRIKHERDRTFEGRGKNVLSDVALEISSIDPDIVLMPDADLWMRHLLAQSERHGLDPPLTRGGGFTKIDSKSYWSYGKVNYRAGAMMPEGRILIDTSLSFNYNEGGLLGVLAAARLTGLSPNLASRFTPGTLVSSYENYEAMRRGIAVPFRKSEPESTRGAAELRHMDRGGMMFQPEPGVYDSAHQLDFTSLYPSIIVNYNLSPESLADPGRKGFLPEALRPLLELRYRTKQMKKRDPKYAGIDGLLKWMLVTSFGYTGYRNAKFGGIEVHESITCISRDILLRTKEIAEEMGFDVLHGIVDCLWVVGEPILALKERVEEEIGIPAEIEDYDWLAFLRMSDGGGAYNRYFGRIKGGGIKMRGIVAKRRDSSEYCRRMQKEVLDEMCKAGNSSELLAKEGDARSIFERYRDGLREADPKLMVMNFRLGTLDYDKECLQAAAVRAYRKLGLDVAPGMMIGYVVRDAAKHIVDNEWEAGEFDAAYYSRLLCKARDEIFFVFESLREKIEGRFGARQENLRCYPT